MAELHPFTKRENISRGNFGKLIQMGSIFPLNLARPGLRYFRQMFCYIRAPLMLTGIVTRAVPWTWSRASLIFHQSEETYQMGWI